MTLNQRPFNAKFWFKETTHAHARTLAPISKEEVPAKPENEILNQFILNDWEGQGLLSKSSLAIAELKKALTYDATQTFYREFINFNKSLKISIFNDYLDYLEHHKNLNEKNYTPEEFWEELKKENGESLPHQFIQYYCYRVITLYLFKVRFICALSRELDTPVSSRDFSNPTSTLSRYFRKGSSCELSMASLQTNHYSSWYRPSCKIQNELVKLPELFENISLVEFAKLFSDQHDEETDFSHSLSQTYFGQFLNLLLLALPNWEGGTQNIQKCNYQFDPFAPQEGSARPLICKVEGDYLKSIALSHWLAQEANTCFAWKDIICPDFIGESIKTGPFIRMTYELQFLHSLISIAKTQGQHPLDFIVKTCKQKNKRELSLKQSFEQFSLFEELGQSKKVYERVVLNLCKFPTNNAHYHLINQINSQVENITIDGHILVFSQQNLFVPSQTTRTKQVFNKLELKARICFDELKGRGEIASYLYIFKKVPSKNIVGQFQMKQNTLKVNSQAPCYTFRVQGELASFQQFKGLLDELQTFLTSPKTKSFPFYHKQISKNITFDFYRDAIKDGQLIESTTSDNSQITHPGFFNKLLMSSIYMEQFFHLEPINTRESHEVELLGINDKLSKRTPLFLVVDNRDKKGPKIDIFPIEGLKAKLSSWGSALCYYFALTPKIDNLNINIFKSYFQSKLGEQIISRTLIGLPAKLKANLNQLLLPKFLLNNSPLPEYLASGLSLFNSSCGEIIAKGTVQLESEYNKNVEIVTGLSQKYPVAIINEYLKFQNTVKSAKNEIMASGESVYTSQIFIESLKKIKSSPILPDNQDYDVKFLLTSTNDINQKLDKIVQVSEEQLDIKIEVLKLYGPNNDSPLIEIRSYDYAINFLKFIIKRAHGLPLSNILKALKMPPATEIKSSLDKLSDFSQSLEEIEKDLEVKIQQLFQTHIR